MWNLFFAVVESSLSRELGFNRNVHSTKLLRQRIASVRPFEPVLGLTGMKATTKFAMKMKNKLEHIKQQKLESEHQPSIFEGSNHAQVAPIGDDGKLQTPRRSKIPRNPSIDEDEALLVNNLTSSGQQDESDADIEGENAPSSCNVCTKRTKKCCLRGAGWYSSLLVTSSKFESFFMWVIVVNIAIIVAATYFPRPPCNSSNEYDREMFWKWQVYFSTRDHIGFYVGIHCHNCTFCKITPPPLPVRLTNPYAIPVFCRRRHHFHLHLSGGDGAEDDWPRCGGLLLEVQQRTWPALGWEKHSGCFRVHCDTCSFYRGSKSRKSVGSLCINKWLQKREPPPARFWGPNCDFQGGSTSPDYPLLEGCICLSFAQLLDGVKIQTHTKNIFYSLTHVFVSCFAMFSTVYSPSTGKCKLSSARWIRSSGSCQSSGCTLS